MTKKGFKLLDCPLDVIFLILLQLDYTDLVSVASTCRLLKFLANDTIVSRSVVRKKAIKLHNAEISRLTVWSIVDRLLRQMHREAAETHASVETTPEKQGIFEIKELLEHDDYSSEEIEDTNDHSKVANKKHFFEKLMKEHVESPTIVRKPSQESVASRLVKYMELVEEEVPKHHWKLPLHEGTGRKPHKTIISAKVMNNSRISYEVLGE